jgi:hypothetical protein
MADIKIGQRYLNPATGAKFEITELSAGGWRVVNLADAYVSRVPQDIIWTWELIKDVASRGRTYIDGRGHYEYRIDVFAEMMTRTVAQLREIVSGVHDGGRELSKGVHRLRKAELAAMCAEWETGRRENEEPTPEVPASRYDGAWEFGTRSDEYLRETFELWSVNADRQSPDMSELCRSGCAAIIAECHTRALVMNKRCPARVLDNGNEPYIEQSTTAPESTDRQLGRALGLIQQLVDVLDLIPAERIAEAGVYSGVGGTMDRARRFLAELDRQ